MRNEKGNKNIHEQTAKTRLLLQLRSTLSNVLDRRISETIIL
ncbi:hypothetical protein AVDCRST_MAG84-7626 [uncultured Microcoleus sp.]|uniref:Uncharacterized protein n=1 Tax=uncultured Microcoleus sp. TaxID=259945 RepID=A0A6J4PX80_9CYAN|nr:hypothetical protein AVDCRST_MAG84-7626 [uncultured Microcoleus sp.]